MTLQQFDDELLDIFFWKINNATEINEGLVNQLKAMADVLTFCWLPQVHEKYAKAYVPPSNPDPTGEPGPNSYFKQPQHVDPMIKQGYGRV